MHKLRNEGKSPKGSVCIACHVIFKHAVPCQRQIKVSAKPSTAGRKSVVFQAQFDEKSESANTTRDQRKKGHAQVDNTPHELVCVLFCLQARLTHALPSPMILWACLHFAYIRTCEQFRTQFVKGSEELNPANEGLIKPASQKILVLTL